MGVNYSLISFKWDNCAKHWKCTGSSPLLLFSFYLPSTSDEKKSHKIMLHALKFTPNMQTTFNMKSAGILSPFLTSCHRTISIIWCTLQILLNRPFLLKLALISDGYVNEVFKQQCHRVRERITSPTVCISDR